MSFNIEYNGITLGDGTDYHIKTIGGFDGLPIRTSDDVNTANHGGNIWEQFYGMRALTIQGRLHGSSASEYFANKKTFIETFGITEESQEMTITRWDGATRTINAKVTEAPMIKLESGQVTFCDFNIELTCEEPFFKSDTLKTGTCALAVGGGMIISTPISIPISAGTGNTITINNEGSIAWYPEISIKGEVINPTVTNITTGESLTLNTTLLASETVTISRDSEGVHVLKGSTNYQQYLIGDLFTLATGNNIIKFTSSGTTTTASLTVNYHDRYLGL